MASANVFQQLLQPPRSVVDYLNDYAKADALQNQNAMQSLTLRQAASVDQQKNALRSLVQSGQIDLSDSAGQAKALAAAPDVAPALLKTVQEGKTSAALALKDTAQAGSLTATAAKTTQDTQIGAHQQHLQQLSTVNTPQDAMQWVIDGVRSGTLPSQGLEPALQRLQAAAASPEAFAQWKQQTAASGLSVQQQLEMTNAKPTEVRLGNVVKTIDMNPRSQTFGKEVVAPQSIGVSPDTAANNATSIKTTGMNNATSRANTAATIGKDFTIAGYLPNGQPADGQAGGLLSPEAKINAAARYNMDGTLPPNLGRGAQGPKEIADILGEAARQSAARGDTPEAQRISQLANKANSAALNKLQTQQTMVGAFEKNFNANADLALNLSNATDRTGVPLVNKWVQAGKRSIAGDPQISQFDVAVKSTVNEYAKIVSGATGSTAATDSEIKNIEAKLQTAQTPAQVAAVISFMKQETQNRMKGFEDQKAELRGSMSPGGASAVPHQASPAASKTVKFSDLK